jgi:chemotaxis protein methyltransferase CheR
VTVAPDDLMFVQRALRDATGVILDDDKGYLLESRLLSLLDTEGITTVSELVQRIRKPGSTQLRRSTVHALLNGETLFFRDIACFDALRTHVIPQLIRSRPERRLTIWSAACSTGQEPYSIAMLLADHFPELDDWQVEVMATDVSPAHLARAREGRYSQFEVNRGLPALMLVKHFTKERDAWQLRPEIRARVKFRELNLIEPWKGLPQFDLVFLRNVMIYWSAETRRDVLLRIRPLLRPDGFIVLGATETTFLAEDLLELIPETRCCFRMRP